MKVVKQKPKNPKKICDRKGCTTPDCHTQIPKVGYICEGCKDDFQDLLQLQECFQMTVPEYQAQLRRFMKTEKVVEEDEPEVLDVDDFFSKFTNQ